MQLTKYGHPLNLEYGSAAISFFNLTNALINTRDFANLLFAEIHARLKWDYHFQVFS